MIDSDAFWDELKKIAVSVKGLHKGLKRMQKVVPKIRTKVNPGQLTMGPKGMKNPTPWIRDTYGSLPNYEQGLAILKPQAAARGQTLKEHLEDFGMDQLFTRKALPKRPTPLTTKGGAIRHAKTSVLEDVPMPKTPEGQKAYNILQDMHERWEAAVPPRRVNLFAGGHASPEVIRNEGHALRSLTGPGSAEAKASLTHPMTADQKGGTYLFDALRDWSGGRLNLQYGKDRIPKATWKRFIKDFRPGPELPAKYQHIEGLSLI